MTAIKDSDLLPFNFSESDTIEEICAKFNVNVNTPAWTDEFGKALYGYITSNGIPQIRTLSLFSGAGGLDIGFHDLGFDIIESVEIESKFCETLMSNMGEGKYFPHSKVNCIDIREYSGKGLNGIDWIIGGPPCQTFSAAGRRASGVLDTSDAREVLFKEYVRLLKTIKPKGLLFENVYGIVGAQNGKPWNEIVASFKEAGYNLYYRILDAADYGTPQHRERLIIIGLQTGTFKFPRPTHGPDSINDYPFYDAGTAVKGLQLTDEEKATGINGRYGQLVNEVPPGLNYSFFTKEMGHPQPIFAWRSKFSDFLYKADPKQPVRTIKASGGQYTGPLHWDNRYFCFKEYKRLQTFPDTYNISGSRLTTIKQIGNSVPPQLARMLALAIRIQVFATPFPFKMEFLDENAKLSFRKRKRELTEVYQKKAKFALKENTVKPLSFNEADTFYLTLTDRFEYIKSDIGGQYKIHVVWSNESLDINVEPSDFLLDDGNAEIFICPTSFWTLPVSRITLYSYGNSWNTVTAAWKVLDKELIEHSLKADLVQLNGYYQNVSQIKCHIKAHNLKDFNIFSSIITGKAIQRNISTKELATLWNIDEAEVLTKAQMLKKLGYEVRNINTNPQMKKDEWLIPYKFPTLVPQSVQLYKSL